MHNISVGTFTVTPEMKREANEVLDSGRISYGPKSRQFETRFAGIHGCDFGVLSNSGTSSLQVALQALKEMYGWHDGDEVLVPASTFVATVNIVLHCRMTPVLVDIDPTYYEINPRRIERHITDRTRAIIPVHLYGQPCEMDTIQRIADLRNLFIIEDSCEAMFVNYRNQPVGSWGDVGCFSTYVAHLLTTGVGGIATTNDDALAVKMRSLVNHGRDGIYISIDDDDMQRGDNLREVATRRFNFESIGHSFRITELEAALALPQLDIFPTMIAARQRNAAHLTEQLQAYPLQLPAIRKDTEHAFMMYPIVYTGQDKWPLCHYLEAHGIETREMLRITDQPAYAGLFNSDHYPVAKAVNRSGFYVGCHQDLTLDDMNYIAEVVHGYFNER